MKFKFKKLLAAVLASAIGLTSVFTCASADTKAQVYKVSESTAKNASADSPTTIETGIDGITLTLGADTYKYTSDTKNSPYTGRISGAASPNTEQGKGTYYSITLADTVPVGEVSVGYQLGNGKKFYILDNGNALEDYNGITVDVKTTTISTFNVEGGHTYTVYAEGSKLGFYGFSYREVDKVKDFAAEIDGLSFDLIKGDNTSTDSIDSDLVLPESYESKFGSCDVRWESDMPEVIATNGSVSCQPEAKTVTIKGIFSVQEDDSLVHEKSFTLTTIADADDNAAVQAVKAALTLGDTSALKNNIELPTLGKRATSISWATSDENVITAAGVITRAPSADKTAILTATVSRNDASTTKDFTVTVKGYVPVEFDGYVYGDADGNNSFKPVDGGTLKTVMFTESIQNKTGNEILFCAVYNPNGSLKGTKIIKISDVTSGSDAKSSADVNLPMDSNDTFKVMAFSGLENLEPYVDPLIADDTVSDDAVIYVVGDSTASVYDDKNYPRKGWAQMLGNYFDNIRVTDLALSGRSSKNFKNEVNFTKLKNSIKAGDFLIIQFGHNDSKADDETRYTDPSGDRFTKGSYKNSLMEYVEIAQSVGATPVIATSISRRQLSDSSLEKYVAAARELASEINVPLLDLYARTNGWINEVGLDTAMDMFNYVKPYDSRFTDYAGFKNSSFYAEGTTDNTHININGADLISQWAVEEMQKQNMPLGDKANSYKATYPLPSYADATSKQ